MDLFRSGREEDLVDGFDCADEGLEDGVGDGAKKSSPRSESAGLGFEDADS